MALFQLVALRPREVRGFLKDPSHHRHLDRHGLGDAEHCETLVQSVPELARAEIGAEHLYVLADKVADLDDAALPTSVNSRDALRQRGRRAHGENALGAIEDDISTDGIASQDCPQKHHLSNLGLRMAADNRSAPLRRDRLGLYLDDVACLHQIDR